MVVDQIVQ
jgi:hypothetical protein